MRYTLSLSFKCSVLGALFSLAAPGLSVAAGPCSINGVGSNSECCKSIEFKKENPKCPLKKKPAPKPFIKTVYKTVKEPVYIKTPAPEVKVVPSTASASSTVMVQGKDDCAQCALLMMQNQELQHKLELANQRIRGLTRGYYGYKHRYYFLKDRYRANVSAGKNKEVEKEKVVTMKTSSGTGGIYLGLVVGYGPDGIERNYEAEDEYAIVKQNYKAIFGGRLMGLTNSGFGGGIQVMSNRSVMFDLDIRLK